MEVDLAEMMWQESDATVWNTLAHELETVIECLPAEEDDVEDIEMPGDELRDESEGEEQAPMEDGGQRDGSVAEHVAHSKRDLERVKKAPMKLHTNLGHPGVKEMVRVLKHGRASKLAIQEARRMRCDVCAENDETKASPTGDPSSSAGLGRLHKICEMSEHRVPRYSFPDDYTTLVGNDCPGSETSIPRRWARHPKRVVLDPAGENLHDSFLDPLELNSVETEVTAAESPWQAGIIEANGRAFEMVFKKMLESTQPKDKREIEECIDATVSARNVLLRTHGFSAYQHVFGRDPELPFDVLVPGADVAALTNACS